MALTTNLLAYWKFDESSGNAADSSGNGFTMTNTNTATYVAGKINNAASLVAASSQFFTNPSTSLLVDMTNDWSIAIWVNMATKPTEACIMGQWTIGTNKRFRLQYLGGGTDRFQVIIINSLANGDGATISANTLGSPSTGTWYLIIVRYSVTNNTLGISVNNGTEDTVSRGTVGGPTSTVNTRIGVRENTGGSFWNGQLDAAGIWSRYLTDAEETTLWNGGAGVQYPFSNHFLTMLGAGN